MKPILNTVFMLLLVTAGGRLRAQQDTLAALRKFVHICNDYRQLPLQLELEIRSSGNLILSSADTTDLNIRAVLCQKGTYMTTDGMEQLANDSLLLVVNPKTKRMLLYPNHQSVAARLQALGRQLQDSTLPQLAKKYQVRPETTLGDTAIISLESRVQLPYTSAPAAQLQVTYDATTERPYTVTMVERRLIPVSDSVYKSAAGKSEWIGKTIDVKDSSFFLVREETRVIHFQKIDHRPASDPPVRISDRIARDLTGVYRPVKDFAAFRLIQQVQ